MNRFDVLWEENNADLKRFIYKRISDEAVADDVLQEVFVKIHSRMDTLNEHNRLKSWMYRIARNTVIDYYRRRKTEVALPDNLESIPCNDENMAAALGLCVKNMVDKLPEKYRQAVRLTAYQGLSQKQMGERLGLSLPGAKSRVQRAREKLREMLDECCTFETDCYGKVIDYEPRRTNGTDCRSLC